MATIYCLEAIIVYISIYFLPIFFLSILYGHEHAEQVFIILLYHLPFCYDLDPMSLKIPNKYLIFY